MYKKKSCVCPTGVIFPTKNTNKTIYSTITLNKYIRNDICYRHLIKEYMGYFIY